MDKEIMKGSIDILLLSTIHSKDMYGYEMVKVLKQKSEDLYNMSEGTLYPALKRLENKGWLKSYWDQPDNGARRKYYTITDSGIEELRRKVQEWGKVSELIKNSLGGAMWIKTLKPMFGKL